MEWQSFFGNLKSVFNSKFGTQMDEDTSPAEALDIIGAVESSDVSEQTDSNSAQIAELSERMNRQEQGLQSLAEQIDQINSSLAELSEGRVTEQDLEQINTNLSGLQEQVQKVKMTYTNPVKSIQKTTKSDEQPQPKTDSNSVQVSVSLQEILTGVIRN